MRRFGSRRRWAGRLAALAVGGTLALTACSSQGPVVVTTTITPGAAQVTAPSLSGSTEQSDPQQTPASGTPSGSDPAGSAAGGSDPAGSAAGGSDPASTTSSPSAPAMRVSANPAFGTKRIGPNDPISITVFNAELQKVTMLGDDGSLIKGKITNEKHTWTKSERLKYNVTYTVTGTAKTADGSTQPIEGTFSTVKPKKTMAAYIQIPDGDTVGIAAPIVVTFSGSVKDRAAAEKHLHVSTTDADGNPIKVEGSWGWMQDEDIQGEGVKQSRVHFRPKDFWPAHTRVHVQADLYGVDYGNGWGREDVVRNFKIGPDLRVKTDVAEHRLYVIKNDDTIIKNYAVSYGVPKTQDDGKTTVSGIHVITQKKPGEFEMCNPKYGYCGVKEYWGVRINNNGEFIHVNKETEEAGLLGKANVSHGCINMSMHDGKEFFHMVYYGVPVIVTGTGVKMSYSDYIWDWSVSYEQWKTFSAL